MIASIGTVQLNYQTIDPEQKIHDHIVALFIHEALGSIGQWKSFPQEVCNELGIEGLVYERQGHGKSDPFTEKRDKNYLHRYALEELPAFIDTVIPSTKQLLLIGHSDGGSISLLYDHIYPERVKGMITMAAHVINEAETIAGIYPAVKAYNLGKLDGLKRYHGDKTDDLFQAWANIWTDENFRNWNITNEIGSNNPALFIQGKADQYGTEKQLELIESHFENGNSLLLDQCGHHPHLEQKERIISVISDFFSNLI